MRASRYGTRSLDVLATVPAAHQRVLTEALRAPSAHNAQPWRIRPRPGGSYELHYDHHEYLPADPEDRDAYLCMGTFCETLALAARRDGLAADIELVLERDGADLHVADVRLRRGDGPDGSPDRQDDGTDRPAGSPDQQADSTDRPAGGIDRLADSTDRLAAQLAGRATNRTRYTAEPLPASLRAELGALGCVLVPSGRVARIVRRASELSWRDRRFVADLDAWIRPDTASPDGMTPRQLGLARYEWVALRAAFRLGRLPSWLARGYGARDVRLLGDAPAVAVLCAASDRPADLVEAGRRLLRAWVAICGAGFGYHPISIAIDRPETRPEIAALAGGAGTPVALFRIGRPTGPAGESNRVSLADVILPR